MPNVDVNGTVIEFPDNLSPDDLNKAVATAAEQIGRKPTFLERATADLKSNIEAPAYAAMTVGKTLGPSLPFSFPPTAAAMRASGAEPYSKREISRAGEGALNFGKGVVDAVKNVPKQLYRSARHPIESFSERPISTAMDLITLAGAGSNALNKLRPLANAAARRTLPGIFKSTAGIPEKATEIAISKPEVLRKPPVPEEALNDAVGKPVIEAMKAAKKSVGERFGKIFRRYANMEGPAQEIIDTPVAQNIYPVKGEVDVAQRLKPVQKTIGDRAVGTERTITKLEPGEMIKEQRVVGYSPGKEVALPRKTHSYNEIIVNKNRAQEGFINGDKGALKDLYREYIGTPKSDLSSLTITAKDKLQILTRLKREIQREANFNKAPITNAPIDTAKDMALKTMASEIDGIRSKSNLPGANALAQADEAWREINEIFDTIQRDLSDPGKARDTMMRLLKGDNTWLTSGKMAGKVQRIRKTELLTGQKILEPAMEELTRQVFKDWAGKGFVSQFLKGTGLGASATALLTGNPVPAIALAGSTAATSPRLIRKALRASSRFGASAERLAARTAVPSAAGLSRAFISRDAEEIR